MLLTQEEFDQLCETIGEMVASTLHARGLVHRSDMIDLRWEAADAIGPVVKKRVRITEAAD